MKLALALAVLVVAAQSVQAQQPSLPSLPSLPPLPGNPSSSELNSTVEGIQQACKGQVEKLCSGKQGEEAAACLKSNEQKLSSECKQAFSKLPRPGS